MSAHELGKQIKKARERQGLTQDELAEKAGLSRIYIAKIEGAERESPSLPVLDKIARALGMQLTVQLEPIKGRKRK